MESKTAELEFGVGTEDDKIPDIAIDSNGKICFCPLGTFYQSRIKTPQSQRRLETCAPCSSGSYSPGGMGAVGSCIDCPAGFYCVTPASKVLCPSGTYCPARTTLPSRTPCEPGWYCPEGSRAPLECPNGATCAVPGSPELIIEHNAMLERRETELTTQKVGNSTHQYVVGGFTYALSLSVAPQAPVTVTVEKESGVEGMTGAYDDGLSYDIQTYEFSPFNWNISQSIEIDLQRKAHTFQGTSVTRFKHKIDSKDPVWSSAFVRPMTVTIVDDDECANGAQKYDEASKERTVRKCRCNQGYFIISVDLNYHDSVVQCGKCPAGMVCTTEANPSGQILEEA